MATDFLRRLVLAIVLLGVPGAMGCALTTETIPLAYMAPSQPPKIEGAQRVRLSVTAHDVRPDKTRVGCKKNGFGMEMAPINTSTDIVRLVRESLEWELKRRGFVVDAAGVPVVVSVLSFYNDFDVGPFSADAVANVLLDVRAYGGDPGARQVPTYAARYQGQGRKTGLIVFTGEDARAALDWAFADAMRKVLWDGELVRALLRTAAPPPAPAPAAPGPPAPPAETPAAVQPPAGTS